MINLLSIGFSNIFKQNLNFYEFMSNFSDINITLIIPEYSYNVEYIKYIPENYNFNIQLLLPDTKYEKTKYFSINSGFDFQELKMAILKAKPDIIEIHGESYSRLAYQIMKIIRKEKLKVKTIIYPVKNCNTFLFYPYRSYRNFIYKNIDFAIVKSEFIKNSLLSSGFKKPYKLINTPVNINKDIEKDNSEKLRICIDSDESYNKYAIFFEKIIDYRDRITFTVFNNNFFFEKLKNMGFTVRDINNISPLELEKELLKNDVYIFLKDYIYENEFFTNNIFISFQKNISVIISKKHPYDKLFDNSCHFMEDFDEISFKQFIYEESFRNKFINDGNNMLNRDCSYKTTAFKLFDIYKFLYKINKISEIEKTKPQTAE